MHEAEKILHLGIAFLQDIGYTLFTNKRRRDAVEFKDIIKVRRSALGLTLDDIARHVGVSGATVSRWESGDIENIRRDKIAKLAEVLQVTPAYLMGWENASGEQDLGLTIIDIAKWLSASTDIVEAVMDDMNWPDATDPETLSKISAEVERRKTSTPEGEHDEETFGTTTSSKKLKLLARHLDKIPEETRVRLVKNFEDTIDTYLDAMGIPREGE